MPSINVMDIINKTQTARDANVALASAEVDNAKKAETILAEAEQAIIAQGRSQAIVVQQQLTGQMQAQQRAAKAVDAAGGYEALYGLISRMSQTGAELEKNTQQLAKEQNVRFIDDPLAWIKAQVDWDGTADKVDGGVQVLQAQQQIATTIEGRINQVGQIAKSTAETITAASIEASTDEIAQAAKVQAVKTRLEGLKYNTQGVEAVKRARDQDIAYALGVANFERGQQQLQLALNAEARQREQFEWAKEQKAEAKGFDDRLTYFVGLGQAARGQQPSTAQEIKDAIKLKGGLSKEFEELYTNGRAIANGAPPMISTSAAGTAAVMLKDPRILQQLPEERKKAGELIMNATKVLGAELAKPGSPLIDDKDGKKQSRFINDVVTAQLRTQANFVGNNPDNIFYLGDLGSYAITAGAVDPAYEKYPLFQKTLAPALKSNISLSDPNTVFGLALASVNKGEIGTGQAAADIVNIYRRTVALHLASVGFSGFGISLPKEAAGYRVKIGSDVVDVTNQQQVNAALVKQLVRAKTSDIVNRNAPRGIPN